MELKMTSLFKLEDTVFEVSQEAKNLLPNMPTVTGETNLLSELILCILSSQDKYELALSAVKKMRAKNILSVPKSKKEAKVLVDKIRKTLSSPVDFIVAEKSYSRKLRFFEKKTSYIERTIENVYLNGLTLGALIGQKESPESTRDVVIKYCCGLGPKQASMFLRNIGYHSDYAVLDKHIIDYMNLMGLVRIQGYSNMSTYRVIEEKFKNYACQNNIDLLHLDIAIWTTMRTVKTIKD